METIAGLVKVTAILLQERYCAKEDLSLLIQFKHRLRALQYCLPTATFLCAYMHILQLRVDQSDKRFFPAHNELSKVHIRNEAN